MFHITGVIAVSADPGVWLTAAGAAAMAAGFAADLTFGDPHFLPHPIRLIGKLIEKGEVLTRRMFSDTEGGQRRAGTILALLVMTLSFCVPALMLYAASLVHPLLAFGLEAIMCYQILAVKALKTESMKVYDALAPLSATGGSAEPAESGADGCDLDRARYQVSMIVGRDTQNLTAEQVARAAVETVAENTSDGTVAPMIFMALGTMLGIPLGLPFLGAPLGFFYKSINTMDSMIGYKNDRYLFFGRTAAKLDDLVNFVPARISAGLMIAAAFLLGMDGKNAARIFRRDRFNHASPNSAQTEAVCAGALRVQLAGDAYYFGKLCAKQTIGDALRPLERDDIVRANRLLYGAAWLCLIMCYIGIGAVLWLS